MTENGSVSGSIAKLPVAAAIVALCGLIDSVYLTIHHYTAEPVPCTIMGGCEMVLTSGYAEIYGIPLAAFGALAYLSAISLALLTLFGFRKLWMLFGAQATIMAGFSCWLIYIQAVIIQAFCQFCLLSALSSILLLTIFIISLFVRPPSSGAQSI